MEILRLVFAMVVLIFVIEPFIVMTRISSVKKGIAQMECYEIFKGGEPPVKVLKTTRHLSALYEAPIFSM